MKHFLFVVAAMVLAGGQYMALYAQGADNLQVLTPKTESESFFIINVEGFENEADAQAKVRELRQVHEEANYLWLRDYQSLAQKDLFVVFLGPYYQIDHCIRKLETYRKTQPAAYAVEASQNTERVEIRGKYDIRFNGEKLYLIFIYSDPVDVEDYYASGGEDWGWFTGDVSQYFGVVYPNKVLVSSVYNGPFSESEIKLLEEEMQLENFGYILVKDGEKDFISHDLSGNVIEQACRFFGLPYSGNWRSEIEEHSNN